MFLYRLSLLSKFISIQLIVQFIGMISGILIIRILSKTDYAYFTIANSIQATMNILADSGVGIGLSSIGGKVWQNPYRLGELVKTAMQLRRFFASIITVIVTPILIWILIDNGASVFYTLLIVTAILLELDFYLTNGVLSIVPRLHSRIKQIQGSELIFSGSRLTLLLAAHLIYVNAAVAAFISTFSSGLQSFFIRRWIVNDINIDVPINKEDKSKLLNITKKQIPYFIFYCIQGQLSVFLISIFGRTSNIAELGALGRLGILFSVISSVMSGIVLPGYARCQEKKTLTKRYYQIVFLFLFSAFIFIGLAAFFSKEFLWILGEKYVNLEDKVILIAINAMFHSFNGILWSINSSRAWVEDSWLIIPGTIFLQAFLLFFVDVSTVEGVIKFGVFSMIPTSLVNLHMSFKGLSETK